MKNPYKSIRYFLFVLVIFIFPSTVLAYYSEWTPINYVKNWTSVASSEDGSKLLATVSGGKIWRSVDFGITWSELTGSPTANWTDIASSADGSRIYATNSDFPNAANILVSNDSGLTWTDTTPILNKTFVGISSSANGQYVSAVVNDGQIYVSNDYGLTWVNKESSLGWSAVAISATGQRLIATNQNGYTDGSGNTFGEIKISTDYGTNWSVVGPKLNWYSVASSSDGSKLYAADYGVYDWTNYIQLTGKIYTSTNYGITWSETNSPSKNWKKIAASSDGTKLVAIEENGKIYVSSDSGANWTDKESNRDWVGVTINASGSKMAAVVYGGKIYLGTYTEPESNNSNENGVSVNKNLVVENCSDKTFKINFAGGSSKIEKIYTKKITEIASIIEKCNYTKIKLLGYTSIDKTDSPGYKIFRKNLSSKRASNVEIAIKSKFKYPHNNIKFRIYSLSEKNPIKSNKTEKTRPANRRVEIYLSK